MGAIDRRRFLKVAPAAGAAAYAAATSATAGPESQARARPRAPGGLRIGGTAYTPVRDYPIQPKRYSEVTVTDTFWQPKIATNATVTIPFEVQKLGASTRGFGGNVLEATILSLATHPNPQLQKEVDARVRQLAQAPGRGNGGFEVAASYFLTTGKRDLLDGAVKVADALYEYFRVNNPPFSGGERDATNCIALYRVTGDKKHLDLAKHYLDIRGLENSVNRSRHNQSYKPVL
jgi:uncharacterized protein